MAWKVTRYLFSSTMVLQEPSMRGLWTQCWLRVCGADMRTSGPRSDCSPLFSGVSVTVAFVDCWRGWTSFHQWTHTRFWGPAWDREVRLYSEEEKTEQLCNALQLWGKKPEAFTLRTKALPKKFTCAEVCNHTVKEDGKITYNNNKRE